MKIWMLLGVVALAACGDDTAAVDLAVVSRDMTTFDLSAFTCDVVKQDCPMATQKCTYMTETPPLLTTCATITGSVGAGGTCGAPDGGVMVGVADDCDKGLICLTRPQGTQCHKFCASDADCGTLAFCSHQQVCEYSCTLKGTDCPSGYSCTGLQPNTIGVDQLTCQVSGAKSVGDACVATAECGPDLVCNGSPKQCRPVCNDTHPCTSGTCMPLMNVSPGGGPITTIGYCP